MNRPDIDWTYLRQGLIARLLVCVVSVLALAFSVWSRAQYTSESDSQQQQLAALEQQRTELATRLQARQQYADRFEALAAAGVVGAEHRLDWAQTLRDSATALRLPYLRYTAAPQQPFEAAYLVPGTTAPVLSTTMELQVGLVHEMDLLRLMARLREEAPGMFTVTGCTSIASATNVAPEPDKANLTSSCQLRWFSIPLAGAAASHGGRIMRARRHRLRGLAAAASALLALVTAAGPWVAPAAADPARAATLPALGRLFLTPEQRRLLDAQRTGPASQDDSVLPEDLLPARNGERRASRAEWRGTPRRRRASRVGQRTRDRRRGDRRAAGCSCATGPDAQNRVTLEEGDDGAKRAAQAGAGLGSRAAAASATARNAGRRGRRGRGGQPP